MDAAESKLSISDTATKTIEGGIRSLLRGNKLADVPGFSDDAIAAGATSIADIETLMAELLVARDYLQAEGERVRRINANYAHLAQTASASAKIIADSIGRWHNPEPEMATRLNDAAMRLSPAPSLSPVDDGEPEPKEPMSKS